MSDPEPFSISSHSVFFILHSSFAKPPTRRPPQQHRGMATKAIFINRLLDAELYPFATSASRRIMSLLKSLTTRLFLS